MSMDRVLFFYSSRRRHTRSVSAFLLNRSSDLAVPSFVSGAMAKAGKGLLEGTLHAGTSAVSDKLLDLVGLGGKSAADKGKRSEERRVGKECRSRWSADREIEMSRRRVDGGVVL